ncbi:MAG: hypothetical protein LBM87_02540 [Ruminococcus sp.]|jgi:hypothetical protein|nr:hypothetical protein [Ruminococcus sp.]
MNLFDIFTIIYAVSVGAWVIVTIFEGLASKNTTPLALLPVVILVPVFGLFYALIAWLLKPKNIKTYELNTPYEISEISKHIAEDRMTGVNVIPFEESLVVNEAATRHEMILQVIRKNSVENVPLLSGARKSTDTEIAHYASATLMKLQSTFEKKIREAMNYLSANPDDLFAINRAIDALRQYLDSKLLRGYMMMEQRVMLSKILTTKLQLMPDSKSSYIYAAQNAIEMGDFEYASEIIERFCNRYDTDERGIFLQLEEYLAMGDREGFQRAVLELKNNNVNITARGRELLRFFDSDINTADSREQKFSELITL